MFSKKACFGSLLVVGVILIGWINAIPSNRLGRDFSSKDDNDHWMHAKITAKSRHDLERNTRVFEDASHWQNHAQETLKQKLGQRDIEAEAKNSIMFLGDGMSIATIVASRIYKGQLEGRPGEENVLHLETFPNVGLSKTFCSDSQVADSACSATAYLCGSKANKGTIGVKPTVKLNDCDGQNKPENKLTSILAWAQAAGKSTGVVTTTRITHASPAGTYAQISNRDFENDDEVADENGNPDTCDDIAEQLILGTPGRDINVLLGGGRRHFVHKSIKDPESDESGKRRDGKDLIKTWKENIEIQERKGKYITLRDELLSIDIENTDYLFGLFSPDHLEYKNEQAAANDPSLSEMVETAIKILSKNPKGYFLFVEGGRIDHAHHDNYAKRALIETIEFDIAVEKADNITNDEDTLIVVTADHSHSFLLNGYAKRGGDILQEAGEDDHDLPYTVLSYANGPGYKRHVYTSSKCRRRDLSDDAFNDDEYRQEAMAFMDSETHAGEDVGIFAKGPFAHLFSSVVYQSYIPHAMAYAACIGDGATFCQNSGITTDATQDLSASASISVRFCPYASVCACLFFLCLACFGSPFHT